MTCSDCVKKLVVFAMDAGNKTLARYFVSDNKCS